MKIDRININNCSYAFKSNNNEQKNLKSETADNENNAADLQAAGSNPAIINQKAALNDLGLSQTILIPSVTASSASSVISASSETSLFPPFEINSGLHASVTSNNTNNSVSNSSSDTAVSKVSGNSKDGEQHVTLTSYNNNDTLKSFETIENNVVADNTEKNETKKQSSGAKFVRFFIDKFFG